MARIRTIKPQHCADKQLASITLQAHLVWVLSWCFSDDEGVFEADPLLLKSQLFPRRTDIRIEQMEQWLGQLEKARYIIPFTHEGVSYYLHRTFKTHQKIDRPQLSKIPTDIIRRTLDEYSTNARPCIVKESKGEVKDSIKERKQKFAYTLNAYLDKYGKDMLNAFYKYWSEHGENDRKFRREKEKSWDVERRLETWKENESKFNKNGTGKSEKYAARDAENDALSEAARNQFVGAVNTQG